MRLVTTIRSVLLAASVLAVGACDFDIPDLNNPGIDQLEDNPTRSSVTAAATGLLIGHRGNVAQANGYVAQLGILGREAYNFDQADPRYVGELLGGTLQPGSPFGGNFWAGPYANIRLANIIQRAAPQVAEFSAEEQAAIQGFSKTIEALDLLRVITTRDTNGAVIDTDRGLDDELAPVVGKDEAYAEIARLLDEGADDLDAAGEAFPFALSSGFAGFDTPATFRQVNRAIRARVAAYTGDYATVEAALGEAFLPDAIATLADLEVGAYHAFSTATGDQVNNLINPNIWVHPSVPADAQTQAGGDPDARVTRKVVTVAEGGSAQGLASDLKFTPLYASPSAPVAIIRVEELVLLRAEAAWAMDDLAAAKDDLDLIRTISGGLDALPADPTADEIEDELLYNRRYSLLFEGGHRWIDLRRFERLDDLPLDLPEHVRNARYPIPQPECDARPGEPRCELGSL